MEGCAQQFSGPAAVTTRKKVTMKKKYENWEEEGELQVNSSQKAPAATGSGKKKKSKK